MIKDENITVIRGRLGATKSVNIWDLVVGDIIKIETGARVPADCMIIESTDLNVEEPWNVNPSMLNEYNMSGDQLDFMTTPSQRRKFHLEKNNKDASTGKDPFLKADSLVL